MKRNDTIAALATPPGKSGVAVIRLSGPASWSTVESLIDGSLPKPRMMALRNLTDNGEVLDQALVVVFPDGSSFTGEEAAELHVHGGRATISRVLTAVTSSSETRFAAPGEFTRRALAHGKLDLLQAEALVDLIDADTEVQRKQAMVAVGGGASVQVNRWRNSIVNALALLEASIDFADEEDAPEDVSDDVSGILETLISGLTDALNGAAAAERVRDGFRVALVGSPNSGKSTLFNALVGREAAISSPIPGTTRDVIEALCDFGGWPIVLMDMAGLRDATDPIEKIGVDRALSAVRDADIRLFLSAPDAPAYDVAGLWREGDVTVAAKSDLGEAPGAIRVSAREGDGLTKLKSIILDRLAGMDLVSSLFGRARQRDLIARSLEDLRQASESPDAEVKAGLLRASVRGLDGVIGAVENEEILDSVFARFCMGK